MEETEGLRDNQLASALEKFVLERWRHCGTIVPRTTTAEQALKAIAGGSGHQHQQGGGKPASPNSKRKNKPPFKKSGGSPPNQVPAGQAGQGGQNAQPGGGQQGAVVAAGTAASKQQQGGASNGFKTQNQNQKWQPGPAAPAAAGRLAAQGTAFKCTVPNCGNQDHHFLPECLVFRAMTVNDRWALVTAQNFCELCLKHLKSGVFSCNLAKASGTAFHHPALHVQRTGWSGGHETVYIITKEDSEKPDVASISNSSEEPMEEQIKQGAGDVRTCGPSTFINVDSYKTNSEVVPFAALSCAAVNANENFEIIVNENVEYVENETENVNETAQIDLASKNIESSTGNISVSAEIMPEPVAVADPIVIAEPIAVADPVITGRVLSESTLKINPRSIYARPSHAIALR
jgi:hypothetical protein